MVHRNNISLRALYWEQYHLTSSSMTQIVGLGALSASLQTAPS